MVLKMVGGDLVRDADPPAFLGQIEECAAGRLAEFLQCGVELGAAVATFGSEHIPRDAFGVQTHEDIFAPGDLALHQGHMVLPGERTLERVDSEWPVPRRETRRPGE